MSDITIRTEDGAEIEAKVMSKKEIKATHPCDIFIEQSCATLAAVSCKGTHEVGYISRYDGDDAFHIEFLSDRGWYKKKDIKPLSEDEYALHSKFTFKELQLRDEFAKAIIQEVALEYFGSKRDIYGSGASHHERAYHSANVAYIQAEAMIEARRKIQYKPKKAQYMCPGRING